MAWTLQLLNDDTTLSLNDGSAYSGRPGFLAPPPPVRVAQGGANLFRHGSDIRERVYANRTVTAVIRIHGTSQDNLIANILAVNSLLERAAEYTTTGLGSQVKLRRKWEGATNQVDFHVLTGTLALGDEFSPLHSQNTTFANAVLQLTCKPFAYGAEETIENYVADPGFEVAGTALANWTSSHSGSANGTSARDTSVKKDGNGSLKLVMTSSGDGEVIQRQQQLNDVDAGQVWSFQCWVRVDALSDCKVVMELDYSTGTDVEVATTTVNASEFVKLTANNNTVPGSVTHVILKLRLEATDASATGTVYIDNVVAVKASAVPVAWASSRDIANSGADDAQASVNYIDILDVPGDVPAELQVRILETTAHDEFWAGARHAGRMYDDLWLEGEDGTGVTIRAIANLTETPGASNSDAAFSDGAARYSQLEITSSGLSAINTAETWFRHDFTIATPPSGQFRVLIGAWAQNGQGSSTLTLNADDFQFGVGYTYGAFNLLDLTDPDTTSFVGLPSESMGVNATSNRTIIDIGTVTIPPISTPDNQTAASFVLSIFEHFDNVSITGSHNGQEWNWHLDFVMLMPVDFGANYVSKTSATDVVLLDSMSDTKGLYLLNTSDVVQSFPSNQLGRSPEVHPDGTRVYMLAQTTTDYTVGAQSTVSITYRPRFLHVMGA